MSTDLLQPDRLSQPGSRADEDEVDPELIALPEPPRTQRQLTIVLLIVVAQLAVLMAYALRSDAAYAFASPTAVDVGDLYSLDPGKTEPNQYVRAHGSLGGALALRFERPFESDTYRVAPVLGRRDLWVEIRVPSGEEGGRYVPPTTFGGRLVRWSDSGLRHHGLEQAVTVVTHEALPADGWLLIDGEAPRSARWPLGLALMFAGFAVWSMATVARLLRKVR